MTADLDFDLLEVRKVVASIKRPLAEFDKITIQPVEIKNKRMFQKIATKNNLVFHKNFDISQFDNVLKNLIKDYERINIFTTSYEYILLTNGSLKVKKKAVINSPTINLEHNKKKNYILNEGDNIPAFVELGIFTKDFKLVSQMSEKFKQINRFVEIIDGKLDKNIKKLNIVDFGCGKSYLTFILYHYLKNVRGIDVNIVGYDLKTDVIKKCNEIAKKYHYDNLHFVEANVETEKDTYKSADMIISLHACDTATDFALYYAIKYGVKYIFSVPCCQREINSQIKLDGNLEILQKEGLIKERFSALLTDAIRVEVLKSFGYNTSTIEFVGFDTTPKNILIMAKKAVGKKNKSIENLIQLETNFHFKQKLIELVTSLH